MLPLVVVGLIAGVGLLTVLHALHRDTAVIEPPRPHAPEWDLLPTRTDLARVDFGRRFPGYDPGTVEAAYDALADRYADLLGAADAATLQRARRAIAERLGVEHTEVPEPGGLALPPDRRRPSGGRDRSRVEEALLVEVALQEIERDRP